MKKQKSKEKKVFRYKDAWRYEGDETSIPEAFREKNSTPPIFNVQSILDQRGSNYGEFINNASCATSLKEAAKYFSGWNSMPPDMKEAIDLIFSKISRAITGNPEHIDNWDDIAGYAQLVANRLRRLKDLEEAAKSLAR